MSQTTHIPPFRFTTERWPTRTCERVQDLHALVCGWLRPGLERTLDQCADELFDTAEHARGGADLQDAMASREKLLQGYRLVQQRFVEGIGAALNRIGELPTETQPKKHDQPLSLVDAAEQDMHAAVQKVAARGISRGGPALFELGYRLAVLVGTPPLENGANPLGPHALVNAFHNATTALELPDTHQLKLLACFDRTVIQSLAALYEQANQRLLADGILPQLRAYAGARIPSSADDGDADVEDEDAAQDEREDDVTQADASAGGARQAWADGGTPHGRAGGYANHGSARGAAPHRRATDNVPRGPAGNAAPRRRADDTTPRRRAADWEPQDRRSGYTPGVRTDESIAVLDGLRDLLARRHSGPAAGPVASPEELQTALGALQQHLGAITENASRELRSAKRLRDELLAQLRANQPAGAPPAQLSDEQDDTIELVAGLFEQLSKQAHDGANTRSVLGGLELPMLRMATADHDFFEQPEHPARQLLGTVVEAANDWLDNADGKPDRSLEARLEHLIERANREPPSAGLYTSLLADIEQHLSVLELRAKATERRHVEAMRAQEKLNRSRERADELMTERFAKADPPPRGLLRALLDRAWTDVVALTLLRHGEDDDECKKQLAITDQLLGLAPVEDREQLRHAVETGLRQIGMANDEAAQVAQTLLASNGAKLPANSPSATELMKRLQKRQRLGERTGGERKKETAAKAAKAKAADPDRATPPAAPAADAAQTGTPAAPADTQPIAAQAQAAVAQTETAATTRSAADADPDTSATAANATSAAAVPAAFAAAAVEAATAAPAAAVAGDASFRLRLGKIAFGTWFDVASTDRGPVRRLKLAWYSPISGQALFVDRRGQRAATLSMAELAERMRNGHVREVHEVAREGLLDKAWRNMTRSLRRTGSAAPAEGATR